MRKILVLLLICSLFSACSDDEALVPINSIEGEAEQNTATFSEQEELEDGNEEIDNFIEFIVDDEVVSISIKDIPILKQYLQVQKHPEEKIAEMELKNLGEGQLNFYLLRFSCIKEHCSYLLLHPDSKKSAFLLADFAKFESSQLSPDHTKVAVRFKRLNEQGIPLDHIVVFDLNGWKPLSLSNMDDENGMLQYTWPITSYQWIEDNMIEIRFADLEEVTSSTWNEWNSTKEKKEQTMIYQIDD